MIIYQRGEKYAQKRTVKNDKERKTGILQTIQEHLAI